MWQSYIRFLQTLSALNWDIIFTCIWVWSSSSWMTRSLDKSPLKFCCPNSKDLYICPSLWGAVRISWFVLKKGSNNLSWKSFSWRARLLGADHNSTGSVVSSMDLRPTEKAITITADTRITFEWKVNVTNRDRDRCLTASVFLLMMSSKLLVLEEQWGENVFFTLSPLFSVSLRQIY